MKSKPKPSTAVAMRWPSAIHAEVTKAAEAQGRTFSEFVRTAALQAARSAK